MTHGVLAWHLGLLRAALLVAPALYAGWRTTRALAGLPRMLAVAVVALAELTAVTLVAGLAGMLSLGALVSLQLAVLAPVVWLSRGHSIAPAERMALGAPLAVALSALAISLARALLAPPLNWDSLAYHLPFAVDWLQTGRIGDHRALVLAGAALTASWFLVAGTALYVAYNLRYALPGLALLAVSFAVALEESELSSEALASAGASLAGVQLVLAAPHLALPARWLLTGLAGAGLAALAWLARGLRLVLCVALLDLLAFQLYVEHHQPRTRFDWFLDSYHDGLMTAPARWADGLAGATVALAGPLPPYYLAGGRFSNRVVHLTVEPGRERLPHQVPGGILRTRPDRAAFHDALARVRPHYLVVSRLSPAGAFPPEDGWAQDQPALFRPRVSGAHVRVYEVTP